MAPSAPVAAAASRKYFTASVGSATPLSVRLRRHYVVSPSGCWQWTGSFSGKGYGQIREGRAGSPLLQAHRVAWELVNGPIPAGFLVCHRCDNPSCVNPDHLFVGTHQDNMRDMVRKGRAPRNRTRAKLSPSDVVAIRARRERGEVFSKIAASYGVTPAAINHIFLGRTWRGVE